MSLNQDTAVEEVGREPAAYAQLLEIWAMTGKLRRAPLWERVRTLCSGLFTSMIREPFTSLLSLLTLATALLLFGFFVLSMENIERILLSAQSEIRLTIYFRDDAPAEDVSLLREELGRVPAVEEVVLFSKEDALRHFRKSLGVNSGVLEGLENRNPLPASLEVHFAEGAFREEDVRNLIVNTEKNSFVDQVHFNQTLVERLSEALRSFRWAALAGGCVMLLVTAFIIWNTVSLALYARREELSILKLLGATNWAISVPYLLEGAVEGLLSGFAALLLIWAAVAFAPQLLRNAVEVQMILPAIHHISPSGIMLLLASGTGVSLLSSFYAARAFLREQHDL